MLPQRIRIDAFAFCPHLPDADCQCRKPRLGLARQIEQALADSVDYPHSWTISDKLSDVQFGDALSTRTALIRSRYWSEDNLPCAPTFVVNSLLEAADLIRDSGGDLTTGSLTHSV